MTGANNYSGEWDDDETGGQACARGRHCAETDYQGNPKRGPRAFCATDTTAVGDIIRRLPQTYVEVHMKLPKGQRPGGERVTGGGREAPAPVDLDVAAFCRHMVLVASTWEDAVREVRDLSNPDACPACRGSGESGGGSYCQVCAGRGVIASRDGALLQRACRLLAGDSRNSTRFLSVLLALPETEVIRPVKRTLRVSDLRPGTVVRIDAAGDAWERGPADGAAAGLEFFALDDQARGILGLKPEKRRIGIRCDGCDSAGTLRQRKDRGSDWEPVVRCTACPEVYTGDRYTLLMARWYEAAPKAANAS